MTTATVIREQNLEKQIQKHMGCMSGFLHIFDRHHSLTAKRFFSAKRLPPSPVAVDATSESEISSPPSPTKSETHAQTKPALFESKEGKRSPWRSRKEAPRLSLDSRATTDAKGSLHPKEIRPDAADGGHIHGSPSVIARLMGLDPLLPNSSQTGNHPELRRSASESRVSKDLFRSRFVPNGAVLNSPTQSHVPMEDAVRHPDPRNYSVKKGDATEGLISRGAVNSASQWRTPPNRKSLFYFGDIFPEPKQAVTIYGDIEQRIGTKGINEPSQDLEALKQILEALQLKGLLHSKPSSPKNQIAHRNFVYDENPIVLMKPSRSRVSSPVNRRIGNDYSPANGRNQVRGVRGSFAGARETPPSISPRRERSAKSPTRTGRSSSPTTRTDALAKPKALKVETQRRANDSPGNRRSSPKLDARKLGTDPTVTGRLARSKKPTTVIHRKENDSNAVVLEDESSSSISGSSIATSTDTESSKTNLSERCDKLLHNIAGISTTDPQPSPVSVLDSSFFKDESSSTPSPVGTKRNLDFKDQSNELEEDTWSLRISPVRAKHMESSDDSDFSYISDILEAVHCLPEGSDVFLLLENEQYLQQPETSKVAKLDRKLIFDTVDEILVRNKQLLPWRTISLSLGKIWSEFERIRERYSGEDLFESVCSVLRKDMVGDSVTGWGDCPLEMSEAFLDIERLIFKDLICDSIGDLAALSSVEPKRKLVF